MDKLASGRVTDIDYLTDVIRLEVKRLDQYFFIDIERRNFSIAVGHTVYWRGATLWWHPKGPMTPFAQTFKLIRRGNG